MEMQQVRYFLALARTLNFTRAAEAAHVSQPALTRAIQQLEAEFGGPLFHRERQNTHLTELGRILLPHFESIHGQAEAARKRARDLSNLEGVTLRIGVMATIGPAMVADLILQFRKRHPNVDISMTERASADLLRALQCGEQDLAIMALEGAPDARLHALPLFQERFVVVTARDHPWATREVMRGCDLHHADYVHRTHCEQHATGLREMHARGVQVRRVFSSERDDWVLAMIRAGMGFGIFPEFAVDRAGHAVVPLVDPMLSRTLAIVTVRGRPHSSSVGALVAAARRFAEPRRAS